MILDECPYCAVRRIESTHVASGGNLVARKNTYLWEIWRCNGCGNLLLMRRQISSAGPLAPKRIYPARCYELDSSLPVLQQIRDEYAEAGRDLDVESYRSSMVMGRRVLQRLLKEQGCDQNRLVDQIKYAVDENILRQAFHSLAEEIRQYGNLGAHPDDDQLENCTRGNAETLLNFVCLLVEEFYALPAKAAALKSQRKGQDNSAAASAPDQAATAKRPR